MNANRPASKIFWYTHGLTLTNCKNWCHLTMNMFDNDELAYLREADNCLGKGVVLEEANAHFTNETISPWENNLHRTVRVGNNKLRTYRTFKSDFETEMYLKKPIPFKVRQSFAMFRCGSAALRIEPVRYENVAVNDRICQLCDCGNVEDERHFLISCIALNYERHNLYIPVSQSVTDFNLLSDESKFLTLMSNPLICKFTAMACHEMFKTHRSILYNSCDWG